MSADYFPLRAGAVWEYATEDANGRGSLTIEVLTVEASAGRVAARCRRTVAVSGRPPSTTEFDAVVDRDGARGERGVEFPLPAAVGAEWSAGSKRFRVEALDASVETKAGRFDGCLLVSWLIAEGDGGSGERHYAPGVGLVREVEHDEADPWSRELVGRRAA